MSEYEKGSLGWLREKAKKKGFKNLDDWNKSKNTDRKILTRSVSIGSLKEEARKYGFGDDTPGFTRWAQQNGVLRSPTEINREHNTKTAKNAGFDNTNEYARLRWQHRKDIKEIANSQGLCVPISEYEKCSLGWLREKAKKKGFDNLGDWNKSKNTDRKILTRRVSIGSLKEESRKHGFGDNIPEFIKWATENEMIKNQEEDTWNKAGYKNSKEYYDKCAQKLGYKNNSERVKIRRWNQGTHVPMSENEDCSSFLGVYIGEYTLKEFLSTIFGYVKKMDYGNPKFDFICKDTKQDFIDKYRHLKLSTVKEYKIEIKSRCIQYVGERVGWNFTGIDYNNTADIFILVGWDDRESLRPVHIWIFHRSDMIRGKEFWDRDCFYITNGSKYLKEFKEYELIDELNILKNICNDENYEIS